MTLLEIQQEKRRIWRHITDLSAKHKELVAQEKALKRKLSQIPNKCHYGACLNSTSKHRRIAKMGIFYKMCDHHRMELKAKRQAKIRRQGR